jgi:hypothetical protein
VATMTSGQVWTSTAARVRAFMLIVCGAVMASWTPLPAQEPNDCILDTTGTLRASPTTVVFGQPVTLSWDVQIPPYGCGNVVQEILGMGPVHPRSGSMTVWPVGSGAWSLRVRSGNRAKLLAKQTVTVTNTFPLVNGRPTINIDWNVQQALFVKAITTPNATVYLADDLNMDLSAYWYLPIAPGVHILGGRSSTNPGPRLLTAGNPLRFLLIDRADNVRINGIRLDGKNMGIADADDPGSVGITITSSINVDIGNNEIYGWDGTAVEVMDPDGRLNLENATSVRVHDNYIHHNRHYREQGYGVKTTNAYALIERNVFDYNRHALVGGHEEGTGYLAYRNLLLPNGGQNWEGGPFTYYTHQFDVHGSKTCGGGKDAYCGHAGEYFDYRYNSLMYESSDVIKVRGYPDIRADVTRNVFTPTIYVPITQTDGNNLYEWRNWVGSVASYKDNACDFDGNGLPDRFLATGATWWYRSTAGHWNYLNTSAKKAEDLEFRDFSGDGRCDVRVTADGITFNGGRAQRWAPGNDALAQRTDMVWDEPGSPLVRVWQVKDGAIHMQVVYSPATMVNGTDPRPVAAGDFNGDGFGDFVLRDANGKVFITLLNESGQTIASTGSRTEEQTDETELVPASTNVAGVGDFNADGRSDILWRDASGLLEIWFAGERRNKAHPSRNNSLQPVPEPLTNQIKGIGDFNGDGYSDIVWRAADGQVSIWYLQHSAVVSRLDVGFNDPGQQWTIQGIGDFDADRRSDVLWRHNNGQLMMWLATRWATPTWQNRTGWIVGPDWQVHGVGDFNADGRSDILWRHTSGSVSIWHMNHDWYRSEWNFAASPALRLRALMPQALLRIDMDWRP